MLDTMQVIMWSITYILIIVSGIQSRDIKKVAMPYVSGILNFGWEACALQQSQGFWGHILWFVLDCIIVYFGFRYAKTNKYRTLYIGSLYLAVFVFTYLFTLPNGMLVSSFIIDLIMAMWFVIDRKKLSPVMKLPIASIKLLGSAIAGLHYGSTNITVAIIACLILVCNLYYLYLCVEEIRTAEKR